MCGIGIIFPDSSDKSRTGNKLSAVRRGIYASLGCMYETAVVEIR